MVKQGLIYSMFSAGTTNLCRKAQTCRKNKFKIPITLPLEKILWILFRHIVQLKLPTRLTYQRQNKMIMRSLYDQVYGSPDTYLCPLRHVVPAVLSVMRKKKINSQLNNIKHYNQGIENGKIQTIHVINILYLCNVYALQLCLQTMQSINKYPFNLSKFAKCLVSVSFQPTTPHTPLLSSTFYFQQSKNHFINPLLVVCKAKFLCIIKFPRYVNMQTILVPKFSSCPFPYLQKMNNNTKKHKLTNTNIQKQHSDTHKDSKGL